jgi:predicted kinase
MAILYILCGPSGSGKSTWARNFILESDRLGSNIRYVSRDEIRYSLLKDGEDYFSHEKEVFKRFADTLRHTLIDGFDVVADATHLNEFSRRKLTQAIDMYYDNYEIVMIVFNVDADTCIKRNTSRAGRANVPENIIRNMCRDFRVPTLEEDSRIIEIKEVK